MHIYWGAHALRVNRFRGHPDPCYFYKQNLKVCEVVTHYKVRFPNLSCGWENGGSFQIAHEDALTWVIGHHVFFPVVVPGRHAPEGRIRVQDGIRGSKILIEIGRHVQVICKAVNPKRGPVMGDGSEMATVEGTDLPRWRPHRTWARGRPGSGPICSDGRSCSTPWISPPSSVIGCHSGPDATEKETVLNTPGRHLRQLSIDVEPHLDQLHLVAIGTDHLSRGGVATVLWHDDGELVCRGTVPANG